MPADDDPRIQEAILAMTRAQAGRDPSRLVRYLIVVAALAALVLGSFLLGRKTATVAPAPVFTGDSISETEARDPVAAILARAEADYASGQDARAREEAQHVLDHPRADEAQKHEAASLVRKLGR